jgi:DNA-binding CsgD family transcriptional regulator
MSDRCNELTPRQRDCLRLVLTGRSSKHIADVLGISPATVDQHLKSACRLLEQNNRGAAARMLGAWERDVHPQRLGNQPEGLAGPPAARSDELTGNREEPIRIDAAIREVHEPRATYDSEIVPLRRTSMSILFPGVRRPPPNDLDTHARLRVIAIEVMILALSVATLFAVALGAGGYLNWLNAHGG